MELQSLAPMLRTWDLEASLAFYTEILGFECVARAPEWGWAALERDQVRVMFSGPNEHEGDTMPAFTGSLYFRTGDVNGLWEQVRDRARVCYPPENFPYGMREFAIYDNNGYLLQFGQDLSATR